jgi:hypothetical protein
MRKRMLVVIAFLVLGLAVASPGVAAPQPQVRSVITFPESGATVSGAVEVRGIAVHSSMDFYQLRYAAGPAETGGSQWVDFSIVEDTQVQDGVLGVWDTTTIPDGQYTLALAVWGVDDPSNPWLFFARNLTVNNAQPVEMPTPAATEEQPTPEPMPTAVLGPTPTPVSIQQPDTPTPASSPATVGEANGESDASAAGESEGGLSLALDTETLRSAFCTGGLMAVMLFLLWGLYLMAKISVRWYLRQRTGPPTPWE